MIPFSGKFTADLPAINNRHRLKLFRRFFGWDKVPEGLRVLDVGASNYISRELGITDNTAGDLNEVMRTPREEYDVVTCLEVLNHVMQHLTLLRNINAKLKKGGILYLATPKLRVLNYKHGKGNYVEISPESLRTILEYTGFKIKRHIYLNPWPFRFVFYGFLQPIRYFLNKGRAGYRQGTPVGAPPMSWYSFGLRPPVKFLIQRFQMLECEKI